MKKKDFGFLLLLTAGALFVHGYHPYAEDAEIYVPSIVKILRPADFPFGQKFFETNAHLTAFPHLIAALVRLTHIPLDWMLFVGHVVSIFLLLLACLRIARNCLSTPAGRWSSVTLVACLLTLPVAGTSLYIFDEYLNPRSISAFAVVFAIDAAIEKKYGRMAIWLVITAVIHPLMTVFALVFIFLWLVRRLPLPRIPANAALLLVGFAGFSLKAPSAIYWKCLQDHRYYFLLRWTWYEWLGALAPLAILWWCRRDAERHGNPLLARLAGTIFLFELIFFIAGLVVTIPPQLEILAPYQPMRSLQLAYLLMFLIVGGLLGERLLKKHILRWAVFFIPIATGLCIAQFNLFPATRHVEWPGASPVNPWLQAFSWVRENTPANAIFALDPNYMTLPEENFQGFRAAARRSRLADAQKDWSDAALYPWLPLADDDFAQTRAENGWENFGPADFARLKLTYGVTWVVLQKPRPNDLDCPYQNARIEVCRVH